ncbi:MAG TPA: TMEM175 family protein [Chryseolinea sp.]|nr:TMEM175 family protein [Chryseolinea sp.]
MEEKNLQLERTVFFCDAVVAIAITLLALEIKIPPTENGHLTFKDVLKEWRAFAAFFLSFVNIANFWKTHHSFFSHIKKVDEKLLWFNIGWLLFIVLLPFSTSLVSNFFSDSISVIIYSANILIIAIFQNTKCEDTYHSVQEAIQKLGTDYTHDRLIAKFTFGFWTYQFSKIEFAAAGSILLNVFPNRPFGTNQKTVFKNLFKINDIRNRIAHYEPVCFDGNTISIDRTERRYELMLDILTWMGCNPPRLLYGMDGVRKELAAIKAI